MAQAALALDKSIGQEFIVSRAVGLGSLALLDEAVLPEFREDLLRDLGVLRCWCLAEDVEVNAEPLVDVAVNGMILGAKSSGIGALGNSLGLGRCSILVGAANEERGKASCSAKAGKDIGRLFITKSASYFSNRRAWGTRTSTLPMMLPKWGTLLT